MVKTWTPSEVELLKLYPKLSKEEMLKLIPNHSWEGIRHKAERLGFFKRLSNGKKREERMMRVVTLYLQGKTLDEVASTIGVSFATAQRDLARSGIKVRPTAKSREGNDFSEVEAAYIAGFFDGDGSVIINKRVGWHRLEFANTNKNVLEWIRERTGGKIYVTPKPENYKQCFSLRVFRKSDMIYLLKRIVKYLIIKKKDATRLLELLESDRSFNVDQSRRVENGFC